MNLSTKLCIEDQIATLTLNQPNKHNAFDDAIIAELRSHLHTVRNSHDVRALVLQAQGKNFCAGADLSWMKRMAELNYDENLEDAQKLASLLSELNSLPIPTIARVQGAAYGGAIGLIACCDIAIASEDARFCLSEVKLGLAPATIGPYVVSAIGARQCRRLFLTAELFSAQAAKEMNLLHHIVTLDTLDNKVSETCEMLLKTGPNASKAAKSLIFEIEQHKDNIEYKTSELIARLRVSEEGQSGLKSFFAKQPAPWVTDND